MGILTACVCVLGLVVVISGQEAANVSKCCQEGESFDHKLDCAVLGLNFPLKFNGPRPEYTDLTFGLKCKYKKYQLNPRINKQDEFHLLPSGYLKLPYRNESDLQLLSPDKYCLERSKEPNGSAITVAMICYPPPDQYRNSLGIVLFKIGCLISILFLIITMAIYLLIGELQTINGKILICYSSCLTITYAILSYFQFEGDKLVQDACKSIAFLKQFSFVASFFWLNVLCFHTWRAIRNEVLSTRRSSSGRSAFFWYSVYGWGCPFVILAISSIMDLTSMVPISYMIKPNVVLETWKDDTAKLSYFYGPVSIILLVKVVFFLFIICYIHMKFKKGSLIKMKDVAIQIMFNMRKQIFIESVLLFCAMGLNWVLEVISWLVTSSQNQDTMPQLWIFIYTFYTLHGIIIFLVFVVREPKVRRLALQKFCFKSQYHTIKQHDPKDSNLV